MTKDLLLLLLGWLLSTISTTIGFAYGQQIKSRKSFAKLYIFLKGINLEKNILDLSKKFTLGTYGDMFGLKDPGEKLPICAPPAIPSNIQEIISLIEDAESTKGKDELTTELQMLHFTLKEMHFIYNQLLNNIEQEANEDAIDSYKESQKILDDKLERLMRLSAIKRLTPLQYLLKFSKIHKGSFEY